MTAEELSRKEQESLARRSSQSRKFHKQSVSLQCSAREAGSQHAKYMFGARKRVRARQAIRRQRYSTAAKCSSRSHHLRDPLWGKMRRQNLIFIVAFVRAVPSKAPDQYETCRTWAESGECESNPAFMTSNCATSCASATSYKSQMMRECEGYAQQGECSRNPAFMLSTCRKECEAWEKEHGLRIDRDANCVEWSILGRCTEDPERMALTCNTSCTVHERCAKSTYSGWSVGICDKALRCEARDKRRDCASRAAAGECQSKAFMMAVECLQACASFDVDAVLSAQKPEMRAILSPHYDVPVSITRAHERCWLPGWSGHNTYKLMLPTTCAAPRSLPWQRARVPPQRTRARADDALTCPLDTTQMTPRVSRGIKRVSMPPHTPHNVSVVQVLASPRVRLLRGFLTDGEVDEILRISQPLFHRSPVRSVATDRRTSSTATLAGGLFGGGGGNWAVSAVRERIAAFSGYADHALEPLQVVRYHPGEKYEPHHDLFDLCDFPQKPRRHLTFLIYLNDMPGGAGGDTTFPRLSLAIRPEKGTALVFNDVLDSGMDDERTEHSGTPPSTGVKYAIVRAMPPPCTSPLLLTRARVRRVFRTELLDSGAGPAGTRTRTAELPVRCIGRDTGFVLPACGAGFWHYLRA